MITKPLKEYSAKAMREFVNSELPKSFTAAQAGNGYEMTIYDVIGSDQTNAATFSEALAEADGAPITIRLSSPGGNVFEGLAMYNSLKNYEGDSTVVVDGVCASIATVFALGANRVLTQDASLWMAHCSWLLTVGNATDLRAEADTLEKIDGNLASIYASKTGQDAAAWRVMMSMETWFTSAEALAIGLVDGIAESPAKPAAKPQASAREPIQTVEEAVAEMESCITRLRNEIAALRPPPTEAEVKLTMDKALRMRRARIATLRDFA